MFGLQLVERTAQRVSLVDADAFDEMHQRRPAVSGVSGLIECLHHQPGNQFVAAPDRCVAVCTVIANLRHQVLLGQPLQHRHHGGVGQVAVGRKPVVNLAHGEGFWTRPQDAHDRVFKLSGYCHGGHAKAKIADYDSQ